jgi:hypothetical protein
MKKTILSVLLLVQLFQNGISQPSFQIILSVKDSSKSFFSHDKVDISVPLRTIDAEENEQPSINACYNLSVIQVKFPFTDWMFWDSSGTRYVWTENPCQLRVDPIRFDCYINLLPLYNQKPEFLNAMKDGGILEARFKMYGKNLAACISAKKGQILPILLLRRAQHKFDRLSINSTGSA